MPLAMVEMVAAVDEVAADPMSFEVASALGEHAAFSLECSRQTLAEALLALQFSCAAEEPQRRP